MYMHIHAHLYAYNTYTHTHTHTEVPTLTGSSPKTILPAQSIPWYCPRNTSPCEPLPILLPLWNALTSMFSNRLGCCTTGASCTDTNEAIEVRCRCLYTSGWYFPSGFTRTYSSRSRPVMSTASRPCVALLLYLTCSHAFSKFGGFWVKRSVTKPSSSSKVRRPLQSRSCFLWQKITSLRGLLCLCLWVLVHVYVRVYASMYVCMYVCMCNYVSLYLRMYVFMHVCMHALHNPCTCKVVNNKIMYILSNGPAGPLGCVLNPLTSIHTHVLSFRRAARVSLTCCAITEARIIQNMIPQNGHGNFILTTKSFCWFVKLDTTTSLKLCDTSRQQIRKHFPCVIPL